MPRTQRLKLKSDGAPAAPVFQPLIDKTLPPVEQAYQYVLQSIMSGELTPGMRIPAEAVAEALGVSRMPVRDGLRRLEGDGAITIFANRGASVAQFSREEIIELIEMRAVLEGHAARAAMPKIGRDDLEELDQLKLRMERAANDLSKWMLRHDEFHNYLTALSRRALLMRQTERMRIMLRPYYHQYYAKTGELEIAGLEHRKIIDALRKGDADHVEQIVRSHALKNVKKIADLAA